MNKNVIFQATYTMDYAITMHEHVLQCPNRSTISKMQLSLDLSG